MLAYTYPLADLFGTMLGFFVLFIWLWLLIVIFSDIFRSTDMGGGSKMLWVLFVIILPFLGIFIYLIARGGKMHERAAAQAVQQQKAFDSYVKKTAGAGTNSTEQLAQLADLRNQGAITDAEFEAQKEKILA
jgi:ABC-type multidrug transport system fused ATPase/permease subunit